MKPMSVGEMHVNCKGQLIQGYDDFMVNDIIYHLSEDRAEQTTFLRQRWQIDWEKISHSVPCVIVTDIVYDD